MSSDRPRSGSDKRADLSSRGAEKVRALLDATLRVVAREGMKSVTHRKVVAEAGQSLGSTHYYFQDLDDLLLESFSYWVDLTIARYSEALEAARDQDELVDALMGAVNSLVSDKQSAILMYELYAQGIRDERFAELAGRWSLNAKRKLTMFCSLQTAVEVEAVMDGITLHSLLMPMVPPEDEVKALLTVILGRDARRSGGRNRTTSNR